MHQNLQAAAGPPVALDDTALERALSAAVLARGRQRVAFLAGRLQSRFALPGWSIAPLRWEDDRVGILVAQGPGSAQVELRFSLGVRGNRSQVGVDFRMAEGTGADDCKRAAEQMVTLLRGTQAPAAPAAAAAG